MKRYPFILGIFFLLLEYACSSEENIPTDTHNLSNTIIYSRGLKTDTSLSEGDLALFNASGALQIDNEILTYSGSHWINNNTWEYTSNGEVYMTVLHPVYADTIYTSENLYSEGELEDILIAQDTISNFSDINLSFKHLFSLLTIHVDSSLQEDLTELQLTVPLMVSTISPSTGEIQTIAESHTTIKSSNADGEYSFILPPIENGILEIGFTTNDNQQFTQTLEPYSFKSGFKYECNLINGETQPGIRTAEDLIAFSLLVNGKTPSNGKTLEDYGESNREQTIYRLLADIELTETECLSLLPIGYSNTKTFNDIFDGGGHYISNLIIPDKSTNSDVGKLFSGLFGYIDSIGVVRNLHIINASSVETPTCTYVGAIAARCYGTINNCSVQNSTLKPGENGYLGVICCRLSGNIINSYTSNNKVSANGASAVGGIAGDSYGYILNCYTYNNSFTTVKNAKSGGIVGISPSNYLLTINNCYVYHQSSPNYWGAAIGLSQNVTINNFLYNRGSLYYETDPQTTPSNCIIYDSNFCIEGVSISTYLNEWISTSGSTDYPDLTFNAWKTNEDGTVTFQ